MNILSCFDGMSCGRIALEKLGIQVDNYYASEIDKWAIQVTKKNYPDTIHVGDVTKVKGSDIPVEIDLLIGGSPCQGFSFAGKNLNFDDPRSKLFFEFVRLLKELKPKYFLLENVRMKQESQDVISEHLGVKPVMINSALVSAQNRVRLYWTNIPGPITQPEDKGIVLKDILLDAAGGGHIPSVTLRAMLHSPKSIAYMEGGNDKWMQAGNRRADRYTQTPEKEKAFTLTANFHKGVPYNYFEDTRFAPPNFRKLTPMECERLQTVPDGYTEGVSNTQRYKMLGNGWTVDVISHIFGGLLSTEATKQLEDNKSLGVNI